MKFLFNNKNILVIILINIMIQSSSNSLAMQPNFPTRIESMKYNLHGKMYTIKTDDLQSIENKRKEIAHSKRIHHCFLGANLTIWGSIIGGFLTKG